MHLSLGPLDIGYALTKGVGVISIADQTALDAALAAPVSGATYLLANSGSKYSLDLTDLNPARPITLTAADDLDPPVFSQIKLTTSSNVVLDGLEFDQTGDARADYEADIWLTSCSGITVDNCTLIGRATQRYTGTETLGCYGVRVTTAATDLTVSNCTLTNHKFSIIADALSALTNVTISDNDISGWQFDAVQLGNVINGLSVTGNYIHRPLGTLWSLNHMDMLQIYTTDASEGSSDIFIDSNVFDGRGGNYTQGPYINDEAGHGLANVTFSNNFVNVSNWFGVLVSNPTNGLIENNIFVNDPTATATDDDPGSSGAGNQPNIYVIGTAASTVVQNNLYGVGLSPSLVAGATASGNVNFSEDQHDARYIYRLFPTLHYGAAYVNSTPNTTRRLTDFRLPSDYDVGPTWLRATGFSLPALPTNLLSNYANFSNASWTKTRTTISNAGLATQQVKETAVTNTFDVRQTLTRTAADASYRHSLRLKNNLSRNKFRAQMLDTDFNTIYIDCDLSAMTLGTPSVGGGGARWTPAAGSIQKALRLLPSGYVQMEFNCNLLAAGGTTVYVIPELLGDAGETSFAGSTSKGMALSYPSVVKTA